jgi:hypothetical protein
MRRGPKMKMKPLTVETLAKVTGGVCRGCGGILHRKITGVARGQP